MKTVYIAKRISRENDGRYVLDINANMHPEEIQRMYGEKTEVNEKFTYNGPWILRQPIGENSLNNFISSSHQNGSVVLAI